MRADLADAVCGRATRADQAQLDRQRRLAADAQLTDAPTAARSCAAPARRSRSRPAARPRRPRRPRRASAAASNERVAARLARRATSSRAATSLNAPGWPWYATVGTSAAELLQRAARGGVVRIDAQRPRVVVARLVLHAGGELEVAEVHERVDVARVACDSARASARAPASPARAGRRRSAANAAPGRPAISACGPVPVCGTVNVPGGSVAIAQASPGCARRLARRRARAERRTGRAQSDAQKPSQNAEKKTAKRRGSGARCATEGPRGISPSKGYLHLRREECIRVPRSTRRRRTPTPLRAVQLDAFRRRDPDVPDRATTRVSRTSPAAITLQAAADRALAQAPAASPRSCVKRCCTR